MFYKVEKGTKLYNQLDELFSCIASAKNEILKFIDSLPNTTGQFTKGHTMMGLELVGFEKGFLPENWVKKYQNADSVFGTPKGRLKITKEIRKKIESLPSIPYNDINKLINYDPWLTEGQIWFCPSWSHTPSECSLIKIPEAQIEAGYKPVKGMKEITKSQFEKLRA